MGVWSLGLESPLEEEMAAHFSILAWKIPWTVEPGRLQFMALQRVGHNWAVFCFHVCLVLFFVSAFFFFFSPLKNLGSHSWFASITKTGWGLDLTLKVWFADSQFRWFYVPCVCYPFINSENLWHIFMFDIYDTHFSQVTLEELYQFKPGLPWS